MKEYLLALLVFVLAIIILRVFKNRGIKKLKRIAERTRTDLDNLLIEFIDSLGWPFYVFISLWLALRFIHLPEVAQKFVSYITLTILTYYIVRGIIKLINYGADKIIKEKQREDKRFDPSAVKLIGNGLKGVLWAVAIIILLQNFGYNISTLVAGLGIGGVAIAFALQSILGDIFACFSIYLDKPFQTGDFIIVGEDLGVVKKIGIKSTRIQTLQGEELVMSNKELTETRVHNYKKMEKRRILFSFGVVYKTPTEKLKKIPNIIREIMEKVENADIDRVHFKKFGDFSLDFEVVYYLNSSDYNKYMDTQQEINLAIKERFEKEGIEMAYPTQTVFVNK